MDNSVLKQITTQDNKQLRIYITISNNSMQVHIFQDGNAWKSKVDKKILNNFAEKHNLTLEVYGVKLLEYIKNNSPDVGFVFKNEEFSINKLVKKLTIKYFTCKVNKIDYTQTVEQILEIFYVNNAEISNQLKTAKKENEEIIQNKNECEEKLKELIEKKESEDNEQLGQFLLILNEKKRQIQHLTELINAIKKGRPTSNPQVQVTNRKRKKNQKTSVQKKEVLSDSESSHSNDVHSSGENTSDEPSEKTPSPDENKPSTSAVNFDFLEDDFAESHILPKRHKHSQEEKDEIKVAAADEPLAKTEEPAPVERSKSPGIDLSTQQLLDML